MYGVDIGTKNETESREETENYKNMMMNFNPLKL